MWFSLLASVLVLGFACAKDRTIDEVIRDAYLNGTQTYDANTVLVDMDMVFTKQDYEARMSGIDQQKGIRGDRYRWSNKQVPYAFARGVFDARQQGIIRRAMDHWETYTCLKMVPRSTQRNYVHIQDNGSGCNSYVGMLGGSQPMNLARSGCIWHHTVVHEFGHAVGFQHEHQRPERDQYITIQWNNVGQRWKFAFDKFPASGIDNRAITYDYRSVMHYGQTAFTVNGGVTIRTVDQRFQNIIGRAPGLVFSDIKLANLLYNCDDRCTNKPNSCPNGGFVGKDCTCWCDSGDWNNPIRKC